MRLKSLGLLPLPLLIAACGSDLDSRNEAAGVDRNGQREFVIQQPQNRGQSSARIVGSEGAAAFQGFDDTEEQEESARTGSDRGDAGDDDEEVVVDAAPDELIDSAQGFSAEPMDDTTGFDPSPEPLETFGD
ncbi:hypothetical protein [Aurantiacibacter sediminis]|uniref:DUF3035 domain-containing protein n=1 Tax=Aurantiacibacter sediminis TaxID=2793064 RepID=A0ABS0N1I3_9SPHN|nr:hypothetical protein [Aurantiacibacter sediminis]MBH5321833.1 hypothetical protein [Aurantiacibacter sediminis]